MDYWEIVMFGITVELFAIVMSSFVVFGSLMAMVVSLVLVACDYDVYSEERAPQVLIVLVPILMVADYLLSCDAEDIALRAIFVVVITPLWWLLLW